jgi:hypothetical protein
MSVKRGVFVAILALTAVSCAPPTDPLVTGRLHDVRAWVTIDVFGGCWVYIEIPGKTGVTLRPYAKTPCQWLQVVESPDGR